MPPSLLDRIKAVTQHGEFTLSSGAISDIYVDIRQVSFTSGGANQIGYALAHKATWDLAYDAVGGTIIGAIPVAMAVARERRIDAFAVRKEAKDHGTGKLIEGYDVNGLDVLVVDDVITSGKSIKHAILAAIAAGANVVGIAVVLDRRSDRTDFLDLTGDHPISIPVRSIFTLDDLR